jgi:phage shock protein C
MEMNCCNCQRDIADYSNFCYFCGTRQNIAPAGPAPIHKRLMRSSVDSKMAGVCGGVAEYLGVDSTIVRLIWVVAALVPPFPAFIAYFVGWLIMPLAPLPVPPAQPAASAAPHTAQPA